MERRRYLLVQEDLGKTLELIRDKGRAGFYEGKVADLVVAEMNKGNGLITKADLQNYHSVWRKPVTGKYKSIKLLPCRRHQAEV
jgi:gamma-glutamyltranspeptidase/glutathione hydrolase